MTLIPNGKALSASLPKFIWTYYTHRHAMTNSNHRLYDDGTRWEQAECWFVGSYDFTAACSSSYQLATSVILSFSKIQRYLVGRS